MRIAAYLGLFLMLGSVGFGDDLPGEVRVRTAPPVPMPEQPPFSYWPALVPYPVGAVFRAPEVPVFRGGEIPLREALPVFNSDYLQLWKSQAGRSRSRDLGDVGGHVRVSADDDQQTIDPLSDSKPDQNACEPIGDCPAGIQASRKIDALLQAAQQLDSAGLIDLADDLRRRADDERQSQKHLLDEKLAQLKSLEAEIADLRGEIPPQRHVLLEIKLIGLGAERLRQQGVDFSWLHPFEKNFCIPKALTKVFKDRVDELLKSECIKVLADPNLVVLEGRPASMLSGGEFPIIIPANASDGKQEFTTEMKEFGVKIQAVATFIGPDRIRLDIQPEISNLDFSNAVEVSGVTVPGITTKRLNTQVEMNLDETALLFNSSVEDGFAVIVTPHLVPPTLVPVATKAPDAAPQVLVPPSENPPLPHEVADERQVMIRLQVFEYNPELLQTLGIAYQTIGDNIADGRVRRLSLNSDKSQDAVDSETFSIRALRNKSEAFQELLRGLQFAGLIQAVGEPSLIVRNRETASFKSSGEFPVLVPAIHAIGAVRTEKREYGVSMTATPTLLDGNRVRLELQPCIVNRDFEKSVEFAGGTVPGLSTTRINSNVEPGLGETVLFQNFPSEDKNKRILMLVTAELVKPMVEPAVISLPPASAVQAPPPPEEPILGGTP